MIKYRIDRVRFLREVRRLMAPGVVTAKGFTQADLGRLLDINPGIVSHWFNQKRPDQMPSPQNCYLLAGHLDIDLLTFVEPL